MSQSVKNLNKINSIKREQVKRCIDIVKEYNEIYRLIIFGSAVNGDCQSTSDLDLCLDIKGSTRGRRFYELARDISWACDHNCDILTYSNLGGRIKEEIDQKGVTVYELS